MKIIWGLAAAVALDLSITTATHAAADTPEPSSHPTGRTHVLTIDDVLGLEHLDGIAPSPDGEWIAAVVQRGAGKGEVYGRTAHEMDPSRNDVWLISRRTHERRNLTQGAELAAGFWCATWSPNGRRLAMLSTRPEGSEPRGGDNVRLYLWDRDTARLSRLGDVAVMTQTRYGGSIHKLDLRDGAKSSMNSARCRTGDENAPFLWLDDHRLLAVTLPAGQVSGLLDEAGRSYQAAAQDAKRLHDGDEPTVEAVGSGSERTTAQDDAIAILQTVDVDTRTWSTVVSVPAYPFRGELTLVTSPDHHNLAVLATTAALPQAAGKRFPNAAYETWTVERRLGVVDLFEHTPLRWMTTPADASYPLELYGWSPDGRRLTLRSRASAFDPAPSLQLVDIVSGTTLQPAIGTMDDAQAGSEVPRDTPVMWLDANAFLVRARPPGGGRAEWWRAGVDGSVTLLTSGWPEIPDSWRRFGTQMAGIASKRLIALDPRSGQVATLATLDREGTDFVLPDEEPASSGDLVIAAPGADGGMVVRRFDPLQSRFGRGIKLPAGAMPLMVSQDHLFWQVGDRTGLFLRDAALAGGAVTDLLRLNTNLATVSWGRTLLIDYRTSDGAPVKGAVILPFGYRAGQRYPTLLWVYAGNKVAEHADYWLDPQMPGIYNLQLYAAQGYVVLVPSMPLPPNQQRQDVYATVTHGVLPALDRLVAMGIADPDRAGVFGQSYGGYTVYALLSQTARFKAAVAMAGISDLAGIYGQFDPLARGYPGIAHEKSSNWIIADQFGQHVPPGQAPADYLRNSPLTYVDRVNTPLLLIHGEHDLRGSMAQAEQFFYGLYARGATARLLRYGGETHSLAQSPANVRDMFGETVRWFDRYVKGGEAGKAAK